MSLHIQKIACSRGHHVLFQDFSLTLDSSDLCIIRGANGTGKTSLLRLLARLAEPDDGKIHYNDKPIADITGLYCTFIGHHNAIKPQLNLVQNVRFPTGGAGAFRALDFFGMKDKAHTSAAHLSAGQKRRVALARLFMTNAPIWLLDEPLTCLDDDGRTRLFNAIKLHRKKQGIVVMSTHGELDLPDAKEVTLG